MSEEKNKPAQRGPQGPGHGVGMKAEKADNFWGTTKRLLRYMSTRSYAILLVFVLAIAAVVFQIQTPKVLGRATTEIFNGVMAGVRQMQEGEQITSFPIDFEKILNIILIVIGMYLILSKIKNENLGLQHTLGGK